MCDVDLDGGVADIRTCRQVLLLCNRSSAKTGAAGTGGGEGVASAATRAGGGRGRRQGQRSRSQSSRTGSSTALQRTRAGSLRQGCPPGHTTDGPTSMPCSAFRSASSAAVSASLARSRWESQSLRISAKMSLPFFSTAWQAAAPAAECAAAQSEAPLHVLSNPSCLHENDQLPWLNSWPLHWPQNHGAPGGAAFGATPPRAPQ